MSAVIVKARLDLIKRGRRDTYVEFWTCEIPKPEGWGTAAFQPFAIEECVEDPLVGVRRYRYDFKLESINTLTSEVFASYEVARSKSDPVERCLEGCGWERGFTHRMQKGAGK